MKIQIFVNKQQVLLESPPIQAFPGRCWLSFGGYRGEVLMKIKLFCFICFNSLSAIICFLNFPSNGYKFIPPIEYITLGDYADDFWILNKINSPESRNVLKIDSPNNSPFCRELMHKIAVWLKKTVGNRVIISVLSSFDIEINGAGGTGVKGQKPQKACEETVAIN